MSGTRHHTEKVIEPKKIIEDAAGRSAAENEATREKARAAGRE